MAIASVPKLTTLVIRDFVDGADLKAALRASSWLPMVVRGTATFGANGPWTAPC